MDHSQRAQVLETNESTIWGLGDAISVIIINREDYKPIFIFHIRKRGKQRTVTGNF